VTALFWLKEEFDDHSAGLTGVAHLAGQGMNPCPGFCSSTNGRFRLPAHKRTLWLARSTDSMSHGGHRSNHWRLPGGLANSVLTGALKSRLPPGTKFMIKSSA